MNLDSVKIKMQLENLDYGKSKYSTQTKTTPDGETQTKFVLYEKDTLGLKHIEILPTTNEVLVEFSAKILQDQYLQGINKNTVERVHSEVKPLINCSLSDFENAVVLRTDITENLMFDSQREKEDAVRSLKLGKSNTAFKVDDYTDRNESIIFVGRQTSYKNRQIYYNKEKELTLARNKEIMKYLQPQYKEISKILRVEQNVTSFDKLRQAIGKEHKNRQLVSTFDKPDVNSVKLNEMLLSAYKPLYQRHKIIMKYANEVDLFSVDFDIKEIHKRFGWVGIYKHCNSSLELMVDLIKEKSNNRMSAYRYINEVKTIFSNNIDCFVTNLLQFEKPTSENSYFKTLEKISQMLAA